MAQDDREHGGDGDNADAESAAKSTDMKEAKRGAAKAPAAAKQGMERAVAEHADDHGHAGHHKPNRAEYMKIFVVLFVLTVLEVAVAQIPGIGKGLLTISLVSLAVTKAAFVGLFYMHLKHETKILRWTVAIPLSAPAIYALVLIADAGWRLTR